MNVVNLGQTKVSRTSTVGVVMSRGERIEGRVALCDFYCEDTKPPGWEDGVVFCLGLMNSLFSRLPENSSDVVQRARSYVFTGYNGREYPHFIALRPEPLIAILRSLSTLRGIRDEYESGDYIRLTPAKISKSLGRSVLVSVDSRKIWPTLDPKDINWNGMHYAEKLLSKEDYRDLVFQDKYAFLRAICAKIPPGA